jgi:hypothetical protein
MQPATNLCITQKLAPTWLGHVHDITSALIVLQLRPRRRRFARRSQRLFRLPHSIRRTFLLISLSHSSFVSLATAPASLTSTTSPQLLSTHRSTYASTLHYIPPVVSSATALLPQAVDVIRPEASIETALPPNSDQPRAPNPRHITSYFEQHQPRFRHPPTQLRGQTFDAPSVIVCCQ